MKKLLSLLLALCMAACLLIPALANEETAPAMTLTKNFETLNSYNSALKECIIFAQGAVGEVTFTSSSASVTIDSNGRVTLGESSALSGTVIITATTEAGQEASIFVNYSIFGFPWYAWLWLGPSMLIFSLYDLAVWIITLPVTLIRGFINLFR